MGREFWEKVLENVVRGYGIGQGTLRIGLLPAWSCTLVTLHMFMLIGCQWDLGARTERELKLVEVITAAGSD